MFKGMFIITIFFNSAISAQVRWQPAVEEFGALPAGMQVFTTNDSLDGNPFRACYVVADLTNRHLNYRVDTTKSRRLTPQQFFARNGQPVLVVNCTFFSYETNQSVNLVMKNGKPLAYNLNGIAQHGKDTLTYKHPLSSALGISKRRKADIAWTFTDSATKKVYAVQHAQKPVKDSIPYWRLPMAAATIAPGEKLTRWKVSTAVGGGPVLVQDGKVAISNNEEMKFGGKAINDKHPRTLMGYTASNELVVMVIEGRNPGKASGASLEQCARLMAGIGCVEALNLDGGGSSCMLINGKETIHPSDKGEQRPVPAVFIIESRNK